MRKRTISFDASDEALLAELQEKHAPFATPHMIVRLAMRQGLRLLREGLEAREPSSLGLGKRHTGGEP